MTDEELATLNAAARAAGMSYGQYVAMQYERSVGSGRSGDKRKSKASQKDTALVELGTAVWRDPECVVCGREFVPKRKTQVCCSPVCQGKRQVELNRIRNVERYRKRHGKSMEPRTCIHCGKAFTPEHASQRLCSYACYRVRVSELTKQRRLAAKGGNVDGV